MATLNAPINFELHLQYRTERLEKALSKYLPQELNNTLSSTLIQSIRYSVLNGGKRLRPLLVYLTGEALDIPLEKLDAAAMAVELIHCYSLIHDDLPAMDNDDLRRGKPTCHKAFDEATAILAGDALQTLAFEVLADPDLNPTSPKQQVQMIHLLAKNSGPRGMVGGQAEDMAAEGKCQTNVITFEMLCEIHQKKTGALIEASVLLPALIADIPASDYLQLQTFAQSVGLSFQIQDDILDIVGEVEQLGKSIGKDQKQNKATFPTLLGIENAREISKELYQKAIQSIAFLNEKNSSKNIPLTKLTEWLVYRTR